MANITDIFSADPKTISQVLAQSGVGFYIPAYQRPFSWSEEKVKDLISDSLHGLELLSENEDSITFIGSIIVINDEKYATIAPSMKNQLPAKVWLVIDGQQRISTIILILIELHKMIKSYSLKLKDFHSNNIDLLLNKVKTIIPLLEKSFLLDMDYSEDDDKSFQFYPRVIRAFEDQWSRTSEATYKSPLAMLIQKYQSFYKYESVKEADFFKNPFQSSSDGSKKTIAKAIKSIKKEVFKIMNGQSDDDFEFFDIYTLAENSNLSAMLFNDESFVFNTEEDREKKWFNDFLKLLRLVLFTKFFIDRVALTIVTCRNEDYAFDMFEALNTTGEPLTAFETFKPSIIRAESLHQYENSITKTFVDNISKYLNHDTNKKQDIVTELLIPFALSEKGIKLSKKLPEQRKFLNNTYKNLINLNEKRLFVKHLSFAAEFMNNIWKKTNNKPFDEIINDDSTQLAISILIKLRHNIVLALLFRYYSQIAFARDKNLAISNFKDLVKTIAAFSILWRSCYKNTHGIDNIYRQFFVKGYIDTNKNLLFAPLNRIIDSNNLPDLNKIKLAFIDILNHNNIFKKENWINNVVDNPIYSVSVPITKILIMASYHNSIIDLENPGFLKKGVNNSNNVLTLSEWNAINTIEHVAPQKPQNKNDWDTNIYIKNNSIHSLGNLTLLPHIENSSVSNLSWTNKKYFFEAVSCDDPKKKEILLKNITHDNPNIAATTIKIIENSNYLSFVKSISLVNPEWDAQFIIERTKNLASLAYDNLLEWLKIRP